MTDRDPSVHVTLRKELDVRSFIVEPVTGTDAWIVLGGRATRRMPSAFSSRGSACAPRRRTPRRPDMTCLSGGGERWWGTGNPDGWTFQDVRPLDGARRCRENIVLVFDSDDLLQWPPHAIE